MTLIGLQQRGAAVAAAPIVYMTACYLCMWQHIEKEKMKITVWFPGLIISVQYWLVCHINTGCTSAVSSIFIQHTAWPTLTAPGAFGIHTQLCAATVALLTLINI